MLFRIIPTLLFQIFFKIILNSKVIIKIIIDPDGNYYGNSLSINGLNSFIEVNKYF